MSKMHLISIHVVCVNDLLLLFPGNIALVLHYMYVCIYAHVFICSSTEGYLGFFKFLMIMNNGLISIYV